MANLLTTNHFCGCFSLRTGGLIFGYFGLITAILGIISSYLLQSTFGVQLNLPCLILSMCWLYGIHEQKPSWLLFIVVLCIINLLLFVFVFTMMTAMVLFLMYLNLSPDTNQNKTYLVRDSLLFFLMYTIFTLATGFKWHVTAVVYSLYKNMKAEEEMNRTKFDRYFIANLTQQFSSIKCKPMII